MKHDDYNYRWKLCWKGSCYRGRWITIGWRHIWWVPLLITIGPLTPALLVMLIYWLAHLK